MSTHSVFEFKLFAEFKISTLERRFKKLQIRMRIPVLDTCGERRILKEKVIDSKLSRYVWTGCDYIKFHSDNIPVLFKIYIKKIYINHNVMKVS